ncbi:MAG: DNA/RNA non-specific endonuclease [Leuconostoc pseudomesenteroides]|uniref:DNA/RNA non-specific endonuclease n=1 Tax=Leuconostoc pseudomesenteroides TaxID=33968 RepID=UPI0039EC1D0A
MVIPGAGVAGKIGTVAKIAEDAGKATKLAKLAGKVVKAASKAKTAITASKIASKVKKAVINSAKVTAAVVKGTAKHFVDPKQLAKVANSTGFMGTPAIKHAADSLAAGVKAGAKESTKISKEANRKKLDSLKRVSKTPSKKVVDNPFVNGKSGKLKPNVQYKVSAPGTNHNYVYETNSAGDISKVKVDELHWKGERDRLTNKRNTPDKLTDDDAGHLIADMFDGSPDLDNLVSQARDLNRGSGSEWKEMENQWRDALTGNPLKKVTDVQIDVIYEAESHRPSGFDVQYKINGNIISHQFTNVMKGK